MNQSIEKLKAGNARFVAGQTTLDASANASKRQVLTEGQQPFAIILACSDSRVPTELIFDQSLGDLFIIRVAGNVATPTQIGSVEYAVAVLGSPLVVVLGHSNCGAVAATLDALQNPGTSVSPHVDAIIEQIAPAIEPLTQPNLSDAVTANVHQTVSQLLADSQIVEDKVATGDLQVVGACYDLKSGEVEFYE